ncbi:peptidase M24, structural domain-containing protein [Chytriomyces sp. MP71]|nr:peptidase M24, structural domain-containing protein [Chytriomyces sp. MP71]
MAEEDVPKVETDENALVPDVVTKYQTAAEIANRAMAKVVQACVVGARINEICKLGNDTILEGTKSVYAKKKDMLKGIAFPTCVSPLNVICHLSPIAQDAEAIPALKDGDVVRIELGAHIDGYAAMAAHTSVVGASKEKPVTGKKADLLTAAHVATETVLRLLKPGNTNYQVTDMISKVAAEYGVKPVQGMMSYQLKRNAVGGTGAKHIILDPTPEQRKNTPTKEFEEGDVFSLDIVLSTGEGIPKSLETHRTTVFRKTDLVYGLKTTSARAAYSTIKKEFGEFPFSISQFEDETKAKMGMTEIQKTGLAEPYAVCYSREDEETVHIILTVLLMANGPLKITGQAWDPEVVKSDVELKDDGIKELLKLPVRASGKKKNKK